MIYVDNSQALKELISVVESNKEYPFFCDIESTGLDWFINDILLFQVMIGKEIYVVDVRELGYSAFKELVNSLNKSDRDKVFHNAKFDLKFILDKTGILINQVYDTMVAEVVLNSGKGKTLYSLAELAEKYADIFMDKEARKEFIDFPKDQPFTESQIRYSALDVKALEPIFKAQWEEAMLTRQSQVIVLESELIPIVAQMEYDGIPINKEEWLEVEKEAIKVRDELVEKFEEMVLDFIISSACKNGLELANKFNIPAKTKKVQKFLEEIVDIPLLRGWIKENFNVKSPKQLLTLLHLMKIRVKSTNAKVLQEFLDKEKNYKHPREYPILELLLQIRKVNKQIDQYGSSFLESVHPRTGRIHTEYFTVGTQTGRFSSNNPNLQNIPRKGGYRECFIPEEGFLFAAVDYSQQEYRLAGAVSGETVIVEAYRSGSDMHTSTGKIVAKKDTINSEERDRGKTVNFAILYGSTEWGLHKNLRITLDEGKEIIDSFWKGYPKLARFMEKVGERVLTLGYSITPFGRRRYNLDKPLYANSHEFKRWEERVLREGKNHIIQGGGADILKMAMVELWLRNPYGRNLRPLLQIHDELVFMVRKDIAEEALNFIIQVMEEVEQKFLGDIPAKADGKLKERWSK